METPTERSAANVNRQRRPVFQVLADRNYRVMWVVGLCVMLARMMAVLVSGYLVLQLTGSVFLTQMAGVAFLLPQVFMGVFTGVIADAFDRRKLVFGAFVIDALYWG